MINNSDDNNNYKFITLRTKNIIYLFILIFSPLQLLFYLTKLMEDIKDNTINYLDEKKDIELQELFDDNSSDISINLDDIPEDYESLIQKYEKLKKRIIKKDKIIHDLESVNELLSLSNEQLSCRSDSLVNDSKILEKLKQDLTDENVEFNNSLRKLTNEILNLRKEIEDLSNENKILLTLNRRNEHKSSVLYEQNTKISEQIVNLNENIAKAEHNIDIKEGIIENKEVRIKYLEDMISKISSDDEDDHNKIVELRKNLTDIIDSKKSIEDELLSVNNKLEYSNKKNKDNEKLIKSLRNEIDILERTFRFDLLDEEITLQQEENIKIKQMYEYLKLENEDLNKANNILLDELDELKRKNNELLNKNSYSFFSRFF